MKNDYIKLAVVFVFVIILSLVLRIISIEKNLSLTEIIGIITAIGTISAVIAAVYNANKAEKIMENNINTSKISDLKDILVNIKQLLYDYNSIFDSFNKYYLETLFINYIKSEEFQKSTLKRIDSLLVCSKPKVIFMLDIKNELFRKNNLLICSKEFDQITNNKYDEIIKEKQLEIIKYSTYLSKYSLFLEKFFFFSCIFSINFLNISKRLIYLNSFKHSLKKISEEYENFLTNFFDQIIKPGRHNNLSKEFEERLFFCRIF